MPEKTVAQKLMIKPGQSVRFINPPANVQELINGIPSDVMVIQDDANPSALLEESVIVLFANHRTDLESLLPGVRAALTPRSILWVAYHKGTSKIKTDIHRDTINDYAGTLGLTGIFMISINDDWSALRLKLTSDSK